MAEGDRARARRRARRRCRASGPAFAPRPRSTRDPHQVADAVLVERSRTGCARGRRPRGSASGTCPRRRRARSRARLRQVVRAEGEEVGVLGDLVRRGCRRAAARSSCRRGTRRLGASSLAVAIGQLAQPAQLLGEADERVHDLDERRLAGPLLRRPRRRARSPAPASRRSPGRCSPSRQPRVPSIGFASLQRADARAHALVASPPRAAAGTRAAAGRAGGSSPAGRPSPRRSPRSRPAGAAAAGRARRGARPRPSARIISCTTGSRSSPKNMCSVRQRPMPSAPNSRALAASLGRVGVRAHLQPAQLVGPAEDRLEVLVDLRRDERRPRRRSRGRCRRRS